MKKENSEAIKMKESNPVEWEALCNAEGLNFFTSMEEMKHIWIPFSIKMKLNKNKKLEVNNWNEKEECDDEENTFLYDLVVTVAHVLDPRTGGNLVAHIKVGETYHQRKEGVTHKQWYLFNDFLIEPIDKCDPVQFDLSWKIPCSLYYARRNLNSRHDLTSR
uniref:PAB-dependent poly(A)-specific ribonuclease subunit PAN2-like n=1 Tax=Callorhinchus milii TaxID=7868 RepID=A0A4W3GSH1_CALMI